MICKVEALVDDRDYPHSFGTVYRENFILKARNDFQRIIRVCHVEEFTRSRNLIKCAVNGERLVYIQAFNRDGFAVSGNCHVARSRSNCSAVRVYREICGGLNRSRAKVYGVRVGYDGRITT